MLKLFEVCRGKLGEPVNAVSVGAAVGMSAKSVKNTVNLLAQANFVKKLGDAIALTPQGLRLVETLKRL